MKVEQVIEQVKKNFEKVDKHFSISIKLDYFKDNLYGDSCHLRFIINDGIMNFTGRTLEEAFQNYFEFDNDFGKHFDTETEVKGFKIEREKLFFDVFNCACENLIDAKKVKSQMKLAV